MGVKGKKYNAVVIWVHRKNREKIWQEQLIHLTPTAERGMRKPETLLQGTYKMVERRNLKEGV